MICYIEYCQPPKEDRGKTVEFGALCTKHAEAWEKYKKKHKLSELHESQARRHWVAFKLKEESKIRPRSSRPV